MGKLVYVFKVRSYIDKDFRRGYYNEQGVKDLKPSISAINSCSEQVYYLYNNIYVLDYFFDDECQGL